MGNLDAFAAVVAAHLRAVTGRIPTTPAGELGGLEPRPGLSGVAEALRDLGPLLAERLLGALELHLDDLPVEAHGLTAHLVPGSGAFAVVSGSGDSEATTAVALLDGTHPGATALVADLVARLTHHPTLVAHLGTSTTPPHPFTESATADRLAAAGQPTTGPQQRQQGPHATQRHVSASTVARFSGGFARAVPPDAQTDSAAARAAREENLRRAARRSAATAPSTGPGIRPVRAPHPRPPLSTTPEARAETAAAARHAAPHLALAVITANAVLHELDAATPAAVVGTALGATALHLPKLPKPAAHTEAVQARRRAEYRFPSMTGGYAEVRDHRITLAEGPTPDTADFSANGLVAVVENGLAVRTATEHGGVNVRLSALTGPPDEDLEWWDEVVEVSWHAHHGGAEITGHFQGHQTGTPPWPGDYRVRVHARGRDGNDVEAYHLAVWEAPPAPEHVLKTLDATEPPYAAHRWVERSTLSEAATVTVVTGSTVERVLAAFGATRQASLRELGHDHGIEPWVAVREVDGAVIAVEYNGYQGTDSTTLAALSESGRAACMFWNVDAMTRLSFAERGHVIAAFEPWAVPDAVADLLEGLPGARHKKARGLTAVARFTGRGITPEDLRAIEDADVAYRIG